MCEDKDREDIIRLYRDMVLFEEILNKNVNVVSANKRFLSRIRNKFADIHTKEIYGC